MSKPNEEAEKKYRRDADLGDPVAQFKLGHAYYVEARFSADAARDYTQATPLIQKAAGQGYDTAVLFLSNMYQSGHGVPVDLDKSRALFLTVAEKGDPLAEYAYALMCWNGDFGKHEPDKAEAWWLKAAEKGLPKAFRALGDFYGGFEGRKALRDSVESYLWYTLAALRSSPGNVPAIVKAAREQLAEQMLPEQVTESARRTQEWVDQHQYRMDAASARSARDRLQEQMSPVQVVEAKDRVQMWLEKHKNVLGDDIVDNWRRHVADPLEPLTPEEYANQLQQIDALSEGYSKEIQDIIDKSD